MRLFVEPLNTDPRHRFFPTRARLFPTHARPHPSFRRTPESRIRRVGFTHHLTSREREASGLSTVPSNLPNMIQPAPAHAATLDIGEAQPIAPLATSPAASPVASVVSHPVCILSEPRPLGSGILPREYPNRTTPLRANQQFKLDPYPSIAILAVSFPSRPWENDPHAEPTS